MDMVRKPPGNAHEMRRARAIMSGPKTSDLDVERQTQERLQRARDRITAAEADALRQIENLEAELRAYAKAHEGLGDTSNALEHIVAEAIESVHAAAHFTMGGSVDAAERHANRIASELDAIVARAHKKMAPCIDRIQRSQASEADSKSVTSFACALEQTGTCKDIAVALDALTAAAARNVAAENATSRTAPSDTRPVPNKSTATSSAAPASADEVATLMGILEHARSIIMRAETLESDRAALSSIAREASKAAENAAARGKTLTSAEVAGLTAQARIIQSRMAAQERPLSDALTRIRALEAQLGLDAAACPRAFKDADAVYARLDTLKAAVREQDKQRYIRSCIDEVMREHGYDVVRSVDFAGNATGEHLMFTDSSASAGTRATGIHAFFTPSGDMMLEVVGLHGESDGLEHDCMDAAASAAEAQDLLAAQTRFCAVYAEIADDLAKRGVINKVLHKAAPDMRHCKTITFASGKKEGATPSSKRIDRKSGEQTSGKTEKRSTKAYVTTRKGTVSAKRPAPAKPSERRRRPAQKPHAREMR